jgi:cysteine desulfuration protein SufE
MTIEEIENEIVSEFEVYPDWLDKYNYLIEIGKSIPVLDEKHKVDNNLINGCQSKVWINAEYKDGKIMFQGDSDAIITKGLAGLIVRVLNNQSPDDILNAKFEFIEKIGLKEHLSPTRANGILALIKQLKLYAMAYKLKYGS